MSQDDQEKKPDRIAFPERTRHAWEQGPSPLYSATFWVWIAVAVLGSILFAYRVLTNPDFLRP